MLNMFFETCAGSRIQVALNVGGYVFGFAHVNDVSHRCKSNSRNPSIQKLLTHQVAGAKQAILDCPQGQPGNLNNFLISEVLRMAQDNQLAISSRKRTHYRLNLYSAFFSLSLLLGS